MNVTATEVILNHFLEMPSYLKLITPVSCLAASLFCINKLKNTNELTAIFASGYGRVKFLSDIAVCAVFVALIQFFMSSFVQPYAKSKKDFFISDGEAKFRNLKSKGLIASTISSGKMWFKSDDYILSFSTYDKHQNKLHDVSLYHYSNSNKVKSVEYAKSVSYIGNAWIADTVESYNELEKEDFSFKTVNTTSPFRINQTPQDFNQIEADITTLNIILLWRYITKLKRSGININEYLVMFLENFSSSIICIIFAFFASIGIFHPNRRNNSFGKSILLVLVFVILYWLVNSYFLELGKSSKIHPLLSTLSVPALFTLYIAYYFSKHRKLT
jgi:lipopolysaccharide export system permease protein